MGLRLDAIVELNKLGVDEMSATEAYVYALSLQGDSSLLIQLEACLNCHLEQYLLIAINVQRLGGRVKTTVPPDKSMLCSLKQFDDNFTELIVTLEDKEEQRLATYCKLATHSNGHISSLSKNLVQTQDAVYCRIQDAMFKTSKIAITV